MIEKKDVDPKCRVCGKVVESVGHVDFSWFGPEEVSEET